MTDLAVETQGLTRRFGERTAVDHLDLEVAVGEGFGLLGPNGAGKTTTIRMLATLLAPTAGSAQVLGFDIVRAPQEVRRRIGYVMQKTEMSNFLLTGREKAELEASLYHIPRRRYRQRAAEVLDLVGLTADADRTLREYSGGMLKRLDLACGLLHTPQLLILDEPSLGLDVQSRHRIWEHILHLRGQGVTVLLATNYLDEADRLCNRLSIIDQGRGIVTDSPTALKRALGADVVHIELERPQELARLLDREPWVQRTHVREEELLVYVEDAPSLLPRLMRVVVDAEISPRRVTYSSPSLDDVFLFHTGHELKEMEMSG